MQDEIVEFYRETTQGGNGTIWRVTSQEYVPNEMRYYLDMVSATGATVNKWMYRRSMIVPLSQEEGQLAWSLQVMKR